LEQDTGKRLYEILKQSKRVVFFGGAGVSTDSGIPDFRSKNGLYNQHDVNFDRYSPEYLLSHSCLRDRPEVFFEFYRQKMDSRPFAPNVTHRFLARLEKEGILSAIVTQNIDGLHQKAGSEKVYEIHGTTHRNYCANCGKEAGEDAIFESTGIPRCPACNGVIRPYVTLYEEGLPEDAVSGAIYAIKQADCLIVAGTSLTVYPAASYVNYFGGKHLVVINKERLSLAQKSEDCLVIQDGMGQVFQEVGNLFWDDFQ